MILRNTVQNAMLAANIRNTQIMLNEKGGNAMKPKEMKSETVYRIIDRETGEAQGSYSRAYCDEYDFNSPDEARSANCHGMFKDSKYKIAKYRVTYELIEDDVDGDKRTYEEAAEKKFEELFRTAFSGKSKIPQIRPYYKPRPKPCCDPY